MNAQTSLADAKQRNPQYQPWMGCVENSLCGLCAKPADGGSYPAQCKHLFHADCLTQCLDKPTEQSKSHRHLCQFCDKPITGKNYSTICPLAIPAVDSTKALHEAIRMCSAKHDRMNTELA